MARRETVQEEYRVSERVVIRPGDRFRANGGPYWRSAAGVKIPLVASGPFQFIRAVSHGKRIVIECLDKTGGFTVLHVAGGRSRIDTALVPRPYRVTGRCRV
jgi:hypothetical protein